MPRVRDDDGGKYRTTIRGMSRLWRVTITIGLAFVATIALMRWLDHVGGIASSDSGSESGGASRD